MPDLNSIPCIALLTTGQIQDWMDGNLAGRGEQHLRRLAGFWQEAEQGGRLIWAAWDGKRLAGQITLQHESQYPPFRKHAIPEIVDLWVHPQDRGRGTGRRLLQHAIAHARDAGRKAIGLGVGVTASFGAAQRLYVLEGFVPDGSGLWVNGRQPHADETVSLQDNVLMMWVKTL